MDDVDRLFLELVERLRRDRPAALAGPITVGDLHERLIPYRLVRDCVGFRSNDDYESALCRLAAGERSYLLGDRVMQQELREALGGVLPDIYRYRAYKDEQVWLNPAAIPPPGDTRYAPPEVRERAEPAVSPKDAEADGEETLEARRDAAADPLDHVGVERIGDDDTEATRELEARTIEEVFSVANASRDEEVETCLTCGEPAPGGAAFCPFCGARLRPASCPNCGGALEPTWRFCPACGTRRPSHEGPA